MKEFNFEVVVKWSNSGIKGKDEQEARENLKESFKQEFNIDLSDNEIEVEQ